MLLLENGKSRDTDIFSTPAILKLRRVCTYFVALVLKCSVNVLHFLPETLRSERVRMLKPRTERVCTSALFTLRLDGHRISCSLMRTNFRKYWSLYCILKTSRLWICQVCQFAVKLVNQLVCILRQMPVRITHLWAKVTGWVNVLLVLPFTDVTSFYAPASLLFTKRLKMASSFCWQLEFAQN